MRTIVDNETGALVMIPQSDKDHRLIFHLLNCSELSEFSRYLELENDKDKEITETLEIAGEQLLTYPSKTQWQREDRTPVSLNSRDSYVGGKIIGFKV